MRRDSDDPSGIRTALPRCRAEQAASQSLPFACEALERCGEVGVGDVFGADGSKENAAADQLLGKRRGDTLGGGGSGLKRILREGQCPRVVPIEEFALSQRGQRDFGGEVDATGTLGECRDRADLAQIEALPIPEAAQLARERAAQIEVERIAAAQAKAALDARAKQLGRIPTHRPDNGRRGPERGFGPSL